MESRKRYKTVWIVFKEESFPRAYNIIAKIRSGTTYSSQSFRRGLTRLTSILHRPFTFPPINTVCKSGDIFGNGISTRYYY